MFVLSPPKILSAKTSPHKTTLSNLIKTFFITKQTGDKMKTKIEYILVLAVIYSLQINFSQEKLRTTC